MTPTKAIIQDLKSAGLVRADATGTFANEFGSGRFLLANGRWFDGPRRLEAGAKPTLAVTFRFIRACHKVFWTDCPTYSRTVMNESENSVDTMIVPRGCKIGIREAHVH